MSFLCGQREENPEPKVFKHFWVFLSFETVKKLTLRTAPVIGLIMGILINR